MGPQLACQPKLGIGTPGAPVFVTWFTLSLSYSNPSLSQTLPGSPPASPVTLQPPLQEKMLCSPPHGHWGPAGNCCGHPLLFSFNASLGDLTKPHHFEYHCYALILSGLCEFLLMGKKTYLCLPAPCLAPDCSCSREYGGKPEKTFLCTFFNHRPSHSNKEKRRR